MIIGYRKELDLKKDDLDENGFIKTYELFHMIEDVSIAHAEVLHAGIDELMKENHIWVLSKLKYELRNKVDPNEKYFIETFPRPKKAVTFGRDYYIRDEKDNIVMEGTSQWCILDFKTRKIARTDVDFIGEYRKEKALGSSFEKIHEKEPCLVKKHAVTEDDIDVNQHVNNCRYVELACEAVGRDVFSSFNIYFAKESRLGDDVYIYKEKQGEEYIVQGKFSDGTVIFQSKGRA